MGTDELSNTALDLGLGLSSSSDDSSKLTKKSSPPQNLDTVREPSLNLSLSGETHDLFFHSDDRIKFNYINDHNKTVDRLSRQDSGGVASSFSNNLSVKRERLDPHHEVEIEKVLRKASNEDDDDDDDDDGINGRKKLRLTKSQSALLEESFKLHSTLNPNQKHELARELKLRTRQVEVWFQNRRARSKLKQTEADCEMLKKCCENLSEENRRLHRELQQLKTLKFSHHYMQFPTLLCPSCDKKINWLS